MRLLIISDTPMYTGSGGGPREAFEATLREIEFVSSMFDEVRWYGYLAQGENPGHSRPPKIETIELFFLPPARGGKSLVNKLKIIPRIPALAYVIWRETSKYEVIHTRGPSVPALIAILISFLKKKKIYWHKYAGNWIQPHPPAFYGIQKKMLKLATHTHVTINGKWPGQERHIMSFENPCFTEQEYSNAMISSKSKKFDARLIVCFVGLISETKGALNLLSAISRIKRKDRFDRFIFVGDGPAMKPARHLAKATNVEIDFKGYMTRESVNDVYRVSHLIVLPSKSEGFPKVIAEAGSFGCIPIVSDVSSINQYVINEKSGFLLSATDPDTIADALDRASMQVNLLSISDSVRVMAASFTYERYAARIQSDILK